jgi:hypothetical protein
MLQPLRQMNQKGQPEKGFAQTLSFSWKAGYRNNQETPTHHAGNISVVRQTKTPVLIQYTTVLFAKIDKHLTSGLQ